MNSTALTPERRLTDMLEAAKTCLAWAAGQSAREISANEVLFDALCRKITVLGEAAGHVPLQLRTQMSAIPWRRVVATRNLLVHQYWLVDQAVHLLIIHNHIPSLIATIEAWRDGKART